MFDETHGSPHPALSPRPDARDIPNLSAPLVIHRRVNQLLFEGYDVPMLSELAKLATAFIPDAKFPKTSRFGLLYNKNNSAEQSFTVGTGAGKYPFTSVLDWNNNTYVDGQSKYRYCVGNFSPIAVELSQLKSDIFRIRYQRNR